DGKMQADIAHCHSHAVGNLVQRASYGLALSVEIGLRGCVHWCSPWLRRYLSSPDRHHHHQDGHLTCDHLQPRLTLRSHNARFATDTYRPDQNEFIQTARGPAGLTAVLK